MPNPQSLCLLLVEHSPGSLQPIAAVVPEARVVRLSIARAEMVPDIISRENVSLTVCDLDPDSSATFEPLRQIRRVHPHLPVVVISPRRDLELVLAAFRKGADDVLIEPLRAADIQGSIRAALEKGAAQLELADMQQRAEQSLDELVLLKTVSETANTEENLQKLLDRVADAIQLALNVELVSLMLASPEGYLEISAARGLPEHIRDKVRIGSGEGISGFVFQQGEPVLINDLATDGRFPQRDGADRYRTGSVLSVPIGYQDRVLGVLNVNNKQDGGGFTAHDQELLTTIAHQTALVIENFKLVTNLHQKTRELEQTHADLVRLHTGRTQFVCNLSHELKTPLTSVLGFADLLLNFYEHVDPGQVHDYIERIHTEALYLEKLLTGMLRLFSLDSGSENWRWQDLALADAIDEVLREYQAEIAVKDLDLEFALADDLTPVWGDQEKLGLLLTCLVDNAIKFNRPGGQLAIKAQNRIVNGLPMVYLGISNEGQSVPLEQAEQIFQGYAQLGDLNTQKPEGVGIGLATCRAILRHMHGSIFLEEPVHQGARFGILLPTKPAFEELEHGTTTD